MKTGSEKRMRKPRPGDREDTPAGQVGRPEQDLAMEKPALKPDQKLKTGFIRMSVKRAFQIKSEKDGEIYGAKEGDIIDVPADVAEELEREFKSFYNHEGTINMKNAKRNIIVRAERVL